MDGEKLQQLQDAIIAGNIPQLVMSALSHAIESRSSDVHIEPEKNLVRVRFRIDGVLRRIVEYPLNIHPAVVSRIKIMSNLKIDEQRIPQDGRSQVTTADGREMDLRISTLPTVNGEKVVMRLQDQSRKIPDLPELGIEGNSLKFIEESLAMPNGIILTTGPTGSGKTTTLYSCLNRLNRPEVNILTIEDPVEIQLDGLNQSQVHPDIDYTFAFGLRTALRQDPNIIMVGEIPVDPSTMELVKEALATLPPNTDIDPALVQGLKFYYGKGCDQCDHIGYKGRVGLYEVLHLNNEIRKLILQRATAMEVEAAGKKYAGMVTLEQNGVIKALQGITTLEEVYRVARHGEEVRSKTQDTDSREEKK